MTVDTKICSQCNEAKLVTEYHKTKRNKDGLNYCCKKCMCDRGKKRYDTAREKMKQYRQCPARKLASYKSSAKQRGIHWDLSKEQFLSFWRQDCYHCRDPIPSIGIDRVDSNLGYSLENCVACCTQCNLSKLDHTEDEWLTHMLRVLKHKGLV
jgi:hypothetical protein